MRKRIVYICTILIMIIFTACKKESNIQLNTSGTEDISNGATQEITTKNKDVYIGMTLDDFNAIGLTYVEDYYERINEIRYFLDGDEGVIVTFKDSKISDIKRFTEPTKRVKLTDLKENMNLYEVIETVGVKNCIYCTDAKWSKEIYVLLDEGVADDWDNMYVASVDLSVNPEDKVWNFYKYYYPKLFLLNRDEVYYECVPDDGTDTIMEIGEVKDAFTYEDVVSVLGKPQRCTYWYLDVITFEWDIVSGKVVYEISFHNMNTGTTQEALEKDVNDLIIARKELKYLNYTK